MEPGAGMPERVLVRVGLAHGRSRLGTPSVDSIPDLATRADELLTNVFEGSRPSHTRSRAAK